MNIGQNVDENIISIEAPNTSWLPVKDKHLTFSL